MDSKKRIAIIYGGFSSERVVSEKSGAAIYKHIQKDLFDAVLVDISQEAWKVVIGDKNFPIDKNDFSYQVDGEKNNFDCAFVIIHGTPGEDGVLQSYFDMLQLPYTTSSAFNMALTFNKFRCNQVLKQGNFDVAKSFFTTNLSLSGAEVGEKVGYPCFIKPIYSGSSFGISKVNSAQDLPAALKYASSQCDQIMIEAFMEGREFTSGVYNFDGTTKSLPVTEILTDADFFNFEAKYEGNSEEITPADLDENTTSRIQQLSKDVYDYLGLKSFARIDYILIDSVPHIIEINTVPGMSEESIIPKQCQVAGIALPQFITDIIESSLKK